ncbi:MAG TPA: hypothetical protein VLH81_01565 [Desulfobacterales bacterium]|nr:hypothetical protein [Desulfobacterales bacterium]
MKSPWNALRSLFAADATLTGLLARDAHGDAAIYPEMRADLVAEADYPMVTTPGASGESRVSASQADAEISTWLTVSDTQTDPEGIRDSIDERMVALAFGTIRSAWFFEGVRVSVRTLGMRDANQPGLLRRRRVWTVGVG